MKKRRSRQKTGNQWRKCGSALCLAALLLLAACKGKTASDRSGLEPFAEEAVTDYSAPDLSGSWDAYYDKWLLSGTEQALELSYETRLAGMAEEWFDLSGYAAHMDYISYDTQTEPWFLFSETVELAGTEEGSEHLCRLSLADLEKNSIELVTEFYSKEEKIHYPTLTKQGIYWLVFSDTIGEATGSWKLYGRDWEQREIRLLREQTGQTMNPCLQGCSDRIVWIEGPDADAVGKEAFHTVYGLDGMGEPEALFQIRNVTNPYMAVSYNDSVLSYVDYCDGAWHVLWYELETKELYAYPIENLEEWEFPVVAATSDRGIVYSTYFNHLYFYDWKSGKTTQIGNTQYELEAAGSYVAWADPDRMVVTDLKTGKAVSLKESLEEKGETVSFLRRTEGKFYTVVENQEIGKLMLGIYSLSGE